MSDGAGTPGALSGLRVIEVGEGVAPAWCCRWLAAFGAEVTKIEPPGGDPLRRFRLPDEPFADPDAGVLFSYLNTGKRFTTLDLDSDDGRTALRSLAAAGDILVHTFTPERLAALGLDINALRREHPGLVEVGLTPFGSDGPYHGYEATSLTLLALGGYQFLTGEPGREPLMLPGHQPEYQTGLFGVIAALSGILAHAGNGHGSSTELAMLEVVASLHQFTVSQYLYTGTIRSRHGSRWENLYPITLYPCRDGHLGFAITTQEQWERLCALIGRPDLVDDPRFPDPVTRRQHPDAIDAVLEPWLAERTKDEFFRQAQEQFRLPVGPLYDLSEILSEPQYAARHFWTRPQGATDGPLHPGLPVIMSETPYQVRSPKSQVPSPKSAGPASQPSLRTGHLTAPLSGLRVLDFTRVWAGPLCTRILADLGAEVVKIEAPQAVAGRPVPQAVNSTQALTLAAVGGMASSKLNRNKESISIDLRRPEGHELVLRLVERSDVLVENFSARVMPQLGLDYPSLRAVNPGLVMLSMPGFGTTGPYQNYMAYGPAIEPMTGVTSLLGYPGEGPLASAIAYPDAVAGVSAAAAILTALVYRQRTGAGQFVDLSQLEATTCLLGEYLLAYQLSGTLPARTGNDHPHWFPHGAYRCQGEDEWISIAVRSDEEWRRFCAAAGLDALGADPALTEAAGRRQHREHVDAAITAWTIGSDKRVAMERLQRAGVAAGAVLNAKDILEDPQLAHRGFFVQARGRDGSEFLMPGTPVVIDGQRRQEWHAAPSPGEHNRSVLQRILGIADEEVDRLATSGVLAGGAARQVITGKDG
jgi:crotonobetainyl-CoA:carnitine CoA-transferase CaiB-like acyl-CoA transferase